MLSRSVFQFGAHAIDLRARTLRAADLDVPLEPKVFDCLAYLIEHRDRAIGRDELISAVWGKVDVSDAMLGQAVLKARRAIGDDGRAQGAIRTVPRFGYQWVAPVEAMAEPSAAAVDAAASVETVVEAGTEVAADEPTADASAADDSPVVVAANTAPMTDAAAGRKPRRWFAAALLLAIAAALAVAALMLLHAPQSTPTPNKTERDALRSDRLVLVLPMRVRSAIADDAWLRLGLLALTEQSLREVPGVEPMSADAAIAAVGKDDAPPNLDALRERTHAQVVITSEAQHRGTGWAMTATIDDRGRMQQVEAEGADAVGTAAALADRIREVLDPRAGNNERRSADPAVRDLAARMQAALYAGQSSHALALADATPTLARAPEIAALRAQTLLSLGRYDDMATPLGTLSQLPEARWRATALVLRARSEVARQQPQAALADLKAAVGLLGPADDRPLLARALSGLGLTQLQLGDVDAAEASLLRARMTVEPAQQPLDMARSDQNLGIIAIRRGRYDEAATMFQRAADTFATFGMVEAEAAALINVGSVDIQRLDDAAALAAARSARTLTATVETSELRREAGMLEADTLARSGLLAEADTRYAAIEREAAATATDTVAWARLGRAALALERGDPAAARAQLDAVPTNDDPHLRLRASVLRLRVALASGDRAQAAAADQASALRESLRESLSDGAGADDIAARAAHAQWLASIGDAGAASTFDAALALARHIGSPLAIRDAAAPYARFRLVRGDLDDARTLAALVAPCAERDYLCAQTVFEVARAGGDALAAKRHAAAAHRLAGERSFDPGKP